jgi:uncharacterized membrane protein YdbT with pleckstrin-like domain
MGYIKKHLMSGETIVYQTKLNWSEYLKGITIIIIGIIIIKSSNTAGTFGGFLVLVGLFLLGKSFLKMKSSEFAVTDKRVLIKVGILRTQSLETMLNKVEGIHVEQGLVDKMFGCGNIDVKGTGGTKNSFAGIDNPFEFRNAVNEQISKQ